VRKAPALTVTGVRVTLAVPAGLALFATALMAAIPPANLGRSLADLSAADRAAVQRAQRAVLEQTPGSVSNWKNESNGHSGEAHLVRNYRQNGMACGEVEHILKVPETRRYVMPLCRTANGAWRLAY
jgi:surface antigen